MNLEFITFEKFNEKEDAQRIAKLLDKSKIEYLIEDNSPSFDPTFANNSFGKEFRIKLQQKDFERAKEILLNNTEVDFSQIPSDYYLLDFSDEELEELILKRDEWNNFDFLLAQKILKQRGKELTTEKLEDFKKSRIEELSKPEESQNTWIIIGYICAILGGLLGVFIGWHLTTHKKTLPNGTRIYSYSEKDRKSGNVILIVAVISLVFWIIFKLFNFE